MCPSMEPTGSTGKGLWSGSSGEGGADALEFWAPITPSAVAPAFQALDLDPSSPPELRQPLRAPPPRSRTDGWCSVPDEDSQGTELIPRLGASCTILGAGPELWARSGLLFCAPCPSLSTPQVLLGSSGALHVQNSPAQQISKAGEAIPDRPGLLLAPGHSKGASRELDRWEEGAPGSAGNGFTGMLEMPLLGSHLGAIQARAWSSLGVAPMGRCSRSQGFWRSSQARQGGGCCGAATTAP